MREKSTKKQFILYMIATFGIAWVIQVAASLLAQKGNTLAFTALLSICMFAPTAGTLIARIPLKGMGFIPKLRGKVRFVFLALWTPLVITTLGAILYFIVFPDRYDPNLTALASTVPEAAMAQYEAAGLSIMSLAVISLIGAITYAPFINMLLALGEEIGWRGAMYPYLKDRFGTTPGRIIGGIIWGMWHWPVMLLAGYEYGTDYPGAPFLGLFAFALFAAVIGIIEDYYYEKTGVIWIPALFHGAINALNIFCYLSKMEYMDQMIFGPHVIGLISGIPALILAIVLCILSGKNKTVKETA
ncbi:MAG: CPBP family intramembrane metalloprotease [Lachnospiraceae bacterium]|nr:CPBP family intramembrane metalloprotease [Lachnospiraceae bacterium]